MRAQMARIAHVAPERADLTGLDALGTRKNAEQCGLADAVEADQGDEAANRQIERDLLESDAPAIAVR
jgi:hypothetical protein